MLLLIAVVVLLQAPRPAAAQGNTFYGWQIQGYSMHGSDVQSLGDFYIQVYRSPAQPGPTYTLQVDAPGYSITYVARIQGGPIQFYHVPLPVNATYPAGTKFRMTVSSTNDSTFGTHTTYVYTRQSPTVENYLQQTILTCDPYGDVGTDLTLGFGASSDGAPVTIGVYDPSTGLLVWSKTYATSDSYGPNLNGSGEQTNVGDHKLLTDHDYLWGRVSGTSISVSDCTHPVYIPGP